MTLANTESSLKQSNNGLQWFEKAEFPPGRGRGQEVPSSNASNQRVGIYIEAQVWYLL